MDLKYDIHLSAYQISKDTIRDFESLGFQRDEFANNTRCEVTAYHGTYRGNEVLPNVTLWNRLCKILNRDKIFLGGLEEEEFDVNATVFFDGLGYVSNAFLPAIETEQPAPNVYKACDIHISIEVEKTDTRCLQCLEGLKVASFDKSKAGKIHRIYTITTETVKDGECAFLILSSYLKTLKGLFGKMKFEKTLKFYRKPASAYTLPLTNTVAFKQWLEKLETVYAK